MSDDPLFIGVDASCVYEGCNNLLVLSDAADLRQHPALSEGTLRRTVAIVIIASCPDEAQMGLLTRLAEHLRLHQPVAPPVILLPRIDGSADKASRTTWIMRLIEGCMIDDVICGQPTGFALTLALQAKMQRLSIYQFKYLHERSRRAHVAVQKDQLSQSIDFAHWQYLRARVFQAIPPMRNDVGDGRSVNGWRILDKVNNGVLGTVFAAVKTEGPAENRVTRTSSMLVINKAKSVHNIDDMRIVNRFLQVMSALDHFRHPNLAHLLNVHHAPRLLFVNMELCAPTTLFRRLRKRDVPVEGTAAESISARQIRSIIDRTCSAVCHLHQVARICHRDIKPESVYVEELPDGTFDLKLGGFELAMILHPGKTCKRACGTMPFAAPEMILAGGAGYSGTAADMWSLGILFLEVICGVGSLEGLVKRKRHRKKHRKDFNCVRPPSHVTAKRIQDVFADGTYVESLLAKRSPEMRDSYLPLVQGLVQVSVLTRFDAADIRCERQHAALNPCA